MSRFFNRKITSAFLIVLLLISITASIFIDPVQAAQVEVFVTRDYTPSYHWCQHLDGHWSTYSTIDGNVVAPDDGREPKKTYVKTYTNLETPSDRQWKDDEGNSYNFSEVNNPVPISVDMHERADAALEGKPTIQNDRVVIEGYSGKGVNGRVSDSCGDSPGMSYPFPITVTFKGYVDVPDDIFLGLEIEPTEKILFVGEKQKFTVYARWLQNGVEKRYEVSDNKLTWSSNAPAKVSVEQGIATGIEVTPGTEYATITAYFAEQDASVSAQVRVVAQELPNLVAVDLVAESAIRVGMPTRFSLYFKNEGLAVAESFTVTVERSGQEIFSRVYNGTQKYEIISNGFNYTFTQAGTESLTLRVDRYDEIEETTKSDNDLTRNFTAEENTMDGDFKIEPGPQIDYRDPFELIPIDIDTGTCTYEYHQFRIVDEKGRVHFTKKIYGETTKHRITFPYPSGIDLGRNEISIKIVSNCGETDWMKTKPLEIISDPDNLPPVFTPGFFEAGDLYGFNPIHEIVEGERVSLRIIQKPFLNPPEPYDPEGDEPITYTWDFARSSSEWIRSLPQEYRLHPNDESFRELIADELGYHQIEVTGCDTLGACTTQMATLNVVPANPIPRIEGPYRVVEGRPLPEPFDGSRSYSPAGRSIIEYIWANKREVYATPGTEIVTLEVIDSRGLRSLSKAEHILTVLPDLPPVAQLEYIPIALRGNPVQFKDTSYSPDGDKIVEREISYQYDSNNDGSFTGEPVIKVNIGEDGTFTETFSRVGHYRFKVYVKENWGKSDTKYFDFEVTNESPEVHFTVEGESPQPPAKEVSPIHPNDLTHSDWKVVDRQGSLVKNGQYWIENDALFSPYNKFQQQWKSITSSNINRLLFTQTTTNVPAPANSIYPLGERRFFFRNGDMNYTYFVELNEERVNVDPREHSPIPQYNSCALITGTVHKVDYENDRIWLKTDISYVNAVDHYVYRLSDLFSVDGTCSSSVSPVHSFTTYRNASDYQPDYVPPGFEGIPHKYNEIERTTNNESLIRDAEGYSYVRVDYNESHGCNGGWYSTTTFIQKQKSASKQNPGSIPHEWRIKYSCEDVGTLQGISMDNQELVFVSTSRHGDSERNYLSQHRAKVDIRSNETGQIVRSKNLPGQFLAYHKDRIVIAEERNNKYYIEFYDLNLNKVHTSPEIKDVSWYTQNNAYRDDYSLPIEMKALVTGDGKLIVSNYFKDILVMDFTGKILHTIPLEFPRSFGMGEGRDPYDTSYSDDDGWDDYWYGIDGISSIGEGKVLASYHYQSDCDSCSARFENYHYFIETSLDNDPVDLFGQWLSEERKVRDGEINYTVHWEHNPRTNLAGSGFSFRIQDYFNMYRVEHNLQETKLIRIRNGTETVLGTIPYPMQVRTDYAFRVLLEGNSIRVYDQNGTPIISVQDSAFREGMYGPYSNTEYFRMKNMNMTIIKTNSDLIENVALVNEPVIYEMMYSDYEDDPQILELSEWHYEHTNPNKFLNAGDGYSGLSSQHHRTITAPNASFDKVGEYRISYSAIDDPHPDYLYPRNAFSSFRKRSSPHVETVIVHRPPVAQFTLSLAGDQSIVWNDTSYDPDRWLSPTNYSREQTGIDYAETRGIVERKYYYVSPSGRVVHEKLVRPQEAGRHEVYMSVKDEYGAWSDWSSQTIIATREFAPDEPPHAGFTITPERTYRGVQVRIDSSAWDYEDGSREHLEHAYYMRNLTTNSAEMFQSNARTTWHKTFNSLGRFEVRQVVRDSAGQSAEAIRTVEIVNRKPRADITTPASRSAASPTIFQTHRPAIHWAYTDEDGDRQTRYQLMIKTEGNDTVVLDTGAKQGSDLKYEPVRDLPKDTVMYAQVRVHDGYEWSDFSERKYFKIHINQPPVAEMISPAGTQSNPTVVRTLRPAMRWQQTDPDPGTTFTGYELRFLDEAGTLIYGTEARSQNTTQAEQNWTVDRDLPAATKIQVQVRVKDEELWSEWSPVKWFYINRPPQADFDYSPNRIWEGDMVYLENRSTDPDGDELSYEWIITKPDGIELKRTSEHVTERFDQIGSYIVKLMVSDGWESDDIVKSIDVGELAVKGFVLHTEDWDQHRKGYNMKYSGNEDEPRGEDVFWAGERFLLEAETTNTNTSTHVESLIVEKGLSYWEDLSAINSEKTEWEGEMYDDDFERLRDGYYTFMFTAKWNNGTEKQDKVVVEIRGNWTEFFRLHRVK